MSAARKHYPSSRPALRFVKERRTYNLFGFGEYMTAREIIALFLTAAAACTAIWGSIWVFCALCYALGIEP